MFLILAVQRKKKKRKRNPRGKGWDTQLESSSQREFEFFLKTLIVCGRIKQDAWLVSSLKQKMCQINIYFCLVTWSAGVRAAPFSCCYSSERPWEVTVVLVSFWDENSCGKVDAEAAFFFSRFFSLCKELGFKKMQK